MVSELASIISRGLILFLCLVVVGAQADILNTTYKPPPEINEDDQQAALDQLDRYIEKLEQLGSQIDRSHFDLSALLDQQEFEQQKIIAFVRDEIQFEQYPGLLRGALGALVSGAGNSLDQALLLAKLLKDAGFEARIVHGRLGNEQAMQLLSGIGRRNEGDGQITGNPQAWEARLAELQDISSAPAPLQYAPVEEAPFFAQTQSTASELIQAMQNSDIKLAEADASSLIAEAIDYFWVESRLGPGEEWQASHPAFGAPVEFKVEAVKTYGHQIPEAMQHRLKIEVFVEQKLGEELRKHRVAGPWERPVANLHGVVLSYYNQPNTLDRRAIETGVGAALNKANLFVPMLNGQAGTAFDLNGSTIDIEALNMDSFGAAAVFQTVGSKSGDAANALSAMAGTEDHENVDLMALTGHWIEYTLIEPGGKETTHQRVLVDLIGEANRSAELTQLRQLSEADIRLALTVQHRFVLATGSYSDTYTTEQVLRRLIDSGPAWRLMLKYLYGSEVKLSDIAELKPSAIPHLALYRTFDMGPEILGAQIAYRASPSMIILRNGLLPKERGFRSVDVVSNNKRVLVRGEDKKLFYDLKKAVAIGVWETAVETLAHDYFGPVSHEKNTFLVFDQAKQQGIKAQVLGPGTTSVDPMVLDGDGLEFLLRDLRAGHAVLIPKQIPAGLDLTGWWRVDPVTGTTLGMMADGRGSEVSEYLLQLVETAIGLISALAKYADCEKYTDTETKACCLVEAHMSNVGGLALGGLLGASLGGGAAALCDTGGLLKGQVKKAAGKEDKWECRFFDGDPDTMIGSGGIVNTDYGGCGLLQ